jgi:hypothetical protein
LKNVEKGDFGPMWTKTGEGKLKEFVNVYKTILKGVLEEIKNTEALESYIEC